MEKRVTEGRAGSLMQANLLPGQRAVIALLRLFFDRFDGLVVSGSHRLM